MTTSLRYARRSMGLSLDEFAALLRANGVPAATKRHLLRIESGEVVPGRAYRVALMAVTGLRPDQMGMAPVVEDEDGARHVRSWLPFGPAPEDDPENPSNGRLPGLWKLRYLYWSTGRNGLFISQYHMDVVHNGDALTAESLPRGVAPTMTLTMDLSGHIATGSWSERTSPRGHYLGDHRWGALQLIINPSRRYMQGQWVGFGTGDRVNSGPIELRWITDDWTLTNDYARELPDEQVELS